MSDTRTIVQLRTELRSILDGAFGRGILPADVADEVSGASRALGRIDGVWPAAPEIELADRNDALVRLSGVRQRLEEILLETADDRHAVDLRAALLDVGNAVVWLLVAIRADILAGRPA